METQKKNIFLWIALAVIVIAIIVYVVLSGVSLPTKQQEVPEGMTTTTQGVVAAPGTSAINEEGTVVTKEGVEVKNDAIPGTPEAPQQSNPVSLNSVPSSAVKLTVTASGFSPASFTVGSGDAVTLSVTSGDKYTHIFSFDDPSLSAVAVGLAPNETRVITFNAPASGEYTFSCGVPGHAGRGEVGKMIVD